MNAQYHGGAAHSGAPVVLVVYSAGARPTTYASNVTAVLYTAGTRTGMANITVHCLGCHSDQNNSTKPFTGYGDDKTPNYYSWDIIKSSVASRYTSTYTTSWGKYTATANAAQKNLTKAYSAHGNAANNQEGWNSSTGVDGAISDTTGTTNVQCFDCHNSHGSRVGSATELATSYTSSTTVGGILKDTTTGLGGYDANYQPVSGGTSSNHYNPGSALCFDCHLNSAPTTTRPWGYNSTFGSTRAIMGYWDTPYFGQGTFGYQTRFAYKSGMGSNQGGHFGESATMLTTPTGTIKGLCTPCHDPHGVSPTLGSNQQYGVPLLKGTWLTSLYKEDTAPATNGKESMNDANAGNAYHIDQNTFGSDVRSSGTGTITETDSMFAGLCLRCHPKTGLTASSLSTNASLTWKSKDRIHRAVAGWGVPSNTKHNYPCSKCHTPHNANLKRLMVTNCLNTPHKGRVAHNASPVLSGTGSDYRGGYPPYWGGGSGSGAIPGTGSGSGSYYSGYYGTVNGSWSRVVTCHESDSADESWNSRTQW